MPQNNGGKIGGIFEGKHKKMKKNIKKFGEMKKVRIFAARFGNDRRGYFPVMRTRQTEVR